VEGIVTNRPPGYIAPARTAHAGRQSNSRPIRAVAGADGGIPQRQQADAENWEQGRRDPTGAAQTLLRVMEHEPEAVKRALTR